MALHFRDAWNALFNRQAVSLQEDTLLDWLGLSDEKNSNSLGEVTYFTCMKMLSETMGKLPLKYYQNIGSGRTRADMTDMAYRLCVKPNDYMSPTTFWGTMEFNCQHYGNAYAYINRKIIKNKYGGRVDVKGIWPLQSNYVTVTMDDAGLFGTEGKLYYEYSDPTSGKSYVFNGSDIIHIKTWYSLDGIMGKSVKEILARTIDGANESQKFMNNLYKQGLTAKMALQYTGDLDKTRRDKLKQRYADALTGAKNAGKIIPVPAELKLTPLNVSLTDAQFFELKKYTALQIAAAFGIKPNQINDYEKSSYANSEIQQLSFLVETMLYRIRMYEDEINSKCLTVTEAKAGFEYHFNEKVLLRTDAQTQITTLATAVQNGIRTPNECRGYLDEPPMDGGDRLIVNGTFIPLEDVGKQYGVTEENQDEEGGE